MPRRPLLPIASLALVFVACLIATPSARARSADTAQPPAATPAAPAGPQPGDEAARKILSQAAGLRQQKRYAEAIAAYTDLIATPGISADLLTTARLEKNSTSIEKALDDNPDLFHQALQALGDLFVTALKGAATVLMWVFILGIAVAFALMAQSARAARPGLLVDVQDLTGSDKDNGSRMLSAELAKLISPDPQGTHSDIVFESMTDLEGGTTASIKPMVSLPGLDSLLNTTANVAIGPLQFTPASILALLSRMKEPDFERTVSGAMFQQGTRTAMTLQVVPKDGPPLENASWQLAADGADARQTVLRRAAARLIVFYAHGEGITLDPNSLEWLLKGFDLVRSASTGPPTEQNQRDAVLCFQSALSCDPANWLARFNLSVISRQLGDNEFAIQNCELLEQLFTHPPASLTSYIKKHPYFEASVWYNHAVALSKIRSWRANKAALTLLDQVLADAASPLAMPAKSARAVCLLFQLDAFRKAGKNAQQHVEDTIAAIRSIKEELDGAAKAGDMSRSLVMSRAVALTAHGCVQRVEGRWADARGTLEFAVALRPDMVDAHLQLGDLYRRAGVKVADDWVSRAKTHLTEALQLQPENREANYQMGCLLADDAVRDFPNALLYFAKAAPHTMASFEAGRIYSDPDFPGADLNKAIEQLRASVYLAAVSDFRLLMLAERLLDAADAQCSAAESAIHAAAAAKTTPEIGANLTRARHLRQSAVDALARAGKDADPHDQSWAKRMSGRAAEVLQKIEALGKPAAPPAPEPQHAAPSAS
jgi:tetratricopeptide (TPR) repeat protein